MCQRCPRLASGGGSAIYMGMILRLLRVSEPARYRDGRFSALFPRILTYDVLPVSQRQCASPRGFDSPHWASLKKEGVIEERRADVTSPEELELIRKYATDARAVLVIDDGGRPAASAHSVTSAYSPAVLPVGVNRRPLCRPAHPAL